MRVKALSGFRSENGDTVAAGKVVTVSDAFARMLFAMRKAVEAPEKRPRKKAEKHTDSDDSSGGNHDIDETETPAPPV